MGKTLARLVVLASAVGLVTAKSSWSILAKNVMPLNFGLDFIDAKTGLIGGWTITDAGPGPEIKRTTDGGKTWDDVEHDAELGVYLAMSFSNATHGMVTGMGLATRASSSYTTDGGLSWTKTEESDIIGVYQDCEAVPGEPLIFAMPGLWMGLEGLGQGVAISRNGGRTLVHHNVKVPVPDASARYVSFTDKNVGYLTSGQYPYNNSEPSDTIRFSEHISFQRSKNEELQQKIDYFKTNDGLKDGAYSAAISKTVDGGKTWTTLYSDAGRFCFGGVHAIGDNVWVVAEGNNEGWIWHSPDAGKTWEQQFHADNAGMLEVKFVDEKEGWVSGVTHEGAFGNGAVWHTVDGGKTWDTTKIDHYIVNDISIVDKDHVYATAFAFLRGSAVLQYVPSN